MCTYANIHDTGILTQSNFDDMTIWTMKLYTWKWWYAMTTQTYNTINYKYLRDSRTNTTTPTLSLQRTSLEAAIPSQHTISISSLAIRSATHAIFSTQLSIYLSIYLSESSTVYLLVLPKVLGHSALRADEQSTTRFKQNIPAIRDCSRRSS
jgi:hypothetical protein